MCPGPTSIPYNADTNKLPVASPMPNPPSGQMPVSTDPSIPAARSTFQQAIPKHLAVGTRLSNSTTSSSGSRSTSSTGGAHTPSRTYTVIHTTDKTGAMHIRLAWITVRNVATKKILGYVDLDEATEKGVNESLTEIFKTMDETENGKKFLSNTSSDPMTFTLATKYDKDNYQETTLTFKKGKKNGYEVKDTANDHNENVVKLRETLFNDRIRYVDKKGEPFNPSDLLEKEEVEDATTKKDISTIPLQKGVTLTPAQLTQHLKNIQNSQPRKSIIITDVIPQAKLKDKELFKNAPDRPHFIPVLTNSDPNDPQYRFLYWDKPNKKLYRCAAPGIDPITKLEGHTFGSHRLGLSTDYSKLQDEHLKAFCEHQNIKQFVDSDINYAEKTTREFAGLAWFQHLTSVKDLGNEKEIFGKAPTKDSIEVPTESENAGSSSASDASNSSTSGSSSTPAPTPSTIAEPVAVRQEIAAAQSELQSVFAPPPAPTSWRNLFSKTEPTLTPTTPEQKRWFRALRPFLIPQAGQVDPMVRINEMAERLQQRAPQMTAYEHEALDAAERAFDTQASSLTDGNKNVRYRWIQNLAKCPQLLGILTDPSDQDLNDLLEDKPAVPATSVPTAATPANQPDLTTLEELLAYQNNFDPLLDQRTALLRQAAGLAEKKLPRTNVIKEAKELNTKIVAMVDQYLQAITMYATTAPQSEDRQIQGMRHYADAVLSNAKNFIPLIDQHDPTPSPTELGDGA